VQAQTRLGSEFQVNTYTTASQWFGAVALDADGDFVVAWMSYEQDGFDDGVFAQRFSSAGVAVGAEFRVNTYTSNLQRSPSVAVNADGDFLIAWHSNGQDGAGLGVFAQRFSSAGAAQGVEFQVNAYTTGNQQLPSVAVDGDGEFVIAWASFQDGGLFGVFARRFTSMGVGLATEFQVNTYTVDVQNTPKVAVEDDGDFVVAWESVKQDDGFDNGVFAQRFSSAGVNLGGEFQVNNRTTSSQSTPSLAVNADGDFLIAWTGTGSQDGFAQGVFARRFSSTGVALGPEFGINAFTTNAQSSPAVVVGAEGGFLVVWGSVQDGFADGVFARRFSSAGVALALEFQVNTHTTNSQGHAAAAVDAEGDFVVVWESVGQDGNSQGMFAQRFGALAQLATLDVDGNRILDALTDGLLVLRYEFGFTGASLATNAIGGGCTRCNAADIQTYLAGLGSTLDIDGNGGALGALTDGLLVIRYLFGFSGGTLTSGAVGGGCSRCDAIMIEPYLAGLD
jgi:hypothetical protein